MSMYMIEFPRPDLNDVTHTRYGYAFLDFATAQDCVNYVADNPATFCNPRRSSEPVRIYDHSGQFPICKYDFEQRRAFWYGAFSPSQGR